MLAKLNGTSSLSAEAQNFLGNYKNLLEQMPEAEATEATIKLMYTSYYAEMGGAGTPPEVPARSRQSVPESGNVTTFRRLPAKPKASASGANETPAAGGADFCLPDRGLCRDPVYTGASPVVPAWCVDRPQAGVGSNPPCELSPPRGISAIARSAAPASRRVKGRAYLAPYSNEQPCRALEGK